MKTVRILFLTVMTLAFALAPGIAKAGFVLIFDDPATSEIDFRVEDQGEGDIGTAEGLIQVQIDEGNLTVVASAESNLDRRSPSLLLSINFLRYAGGDLEIAVTDTDFEILDSATAPARVLAGLIEGGESIQFAFFGDPSNQEFAETSPIASSPAFVSPDLSITYAETGFAGPVGSLTMSAFAEGGSGTEFEINTSFTMALQVGATAPPPVPEQVTCPPNIVGVTVDRVIVSDGCAISDATIQNGDVELSDANFFQIVNSTVERGDIDIDKVKEVSVSGNKVDEGEIKVTDSSNVVVDRNAVNGRIFLRNNKGVASLRNITSADLEVSSNTGSGVDSTKVRRNTVIGTGSIKVSENEDARVINNKAARNIECEDNDSLVSRGNQAGNKDECPKPERELFDR